MGSFLWRGLVTFSGDLSSFGASSHLNDCITSFSVMLSDKDQIGIVMICTSVHQTIYDLSDFQ